MGRMRRVPCGRGLVAGEEGGHSPFLERFFSEHKCSLCLPHNALPLSLGNIIAAFVLSTLVLLFPFWLLLKITQRQADSGFASSAVLHPGIGGGGGEVIPNVDQRRKMCHHWLQKWHDIPAPLHPHKEACVYWPHWWAGSLESLSTDEVCLCQAPSLGPGSERRLRKLGGIVL